MKRKSSKRLLLGRTLAAAGFLMAAAGAAGLLWHRPDGVPDRPGDAVTAVTAPSPPAGASPGPASTPADSSPAPEPSPAPADSQPAPNPTSVPADSPASTPGGSSPAPSPAPAGSPSAVIPSPPESFSGAYAAPDTYTYRLDAPNAPAADAPGFQRIVRIEARRTENPAGGASSDALLVELASVPDREFSVIAVVEAESPPAPGDPEEIAGLHWIMNYSGRQFTKSAVRIASGTKTDAPADAFNTRYQGFGDRAEVEFYGPPGTRYFAVVITDGEYATFAAP